MTDGIQNSSGAAQTQSRSQQNTQSYDPNAPDFLNVISEKIEEFDSLIDEFRELPEIETDDNAVSLENQFENDLNFNPGFGPIPSQQPVESSYDIDNHGNLVRRPETL